VHVGDARSKNRRLFSARTGYSCSLALVAFLLGSRALQNAIAEGDTRTIAMHHIHTDETITITYKREGRYDEAALQKLNWFLRDWRRGEQTQMDPRLIDLVWEVAREGGSTEPIQVVCGYRSPQTNAMLRHRSTGVARFSQHMLGRAMDFYVPGVPLERLREYGLRLQRGGVGFYPESGSPFVHMDVGGIRMWPRMTREQLVRVFPDGRTVHIPTDGKPLPGYALALADIKKRGATPSDTSIEAARNAGVDVGAVLASNEQRAAKNPFARLLGLAKDDDEDDAESAAAPAVAAVPGPPKHPVLAALEHDAKAAEKATAKVAFKVADAASKVKLIRTAEAAPIQRVASTRPDDAASAALTPNQIIKARGYWRGPADGVTAGRATPRPNATAPRQHSEGAVADATGSLSPFAGAQEEPGSAALAYAAQPDLDAAATATGIAALRAAALSATPAAPNATTIAVKRTANQIASAVVTAGVMSIAVVKSEARLDSPWLHAIMLSPSVHRFLTTAALGAHDFRTLAAQMVKPANAVMMTFAADPNPGLDHDRFSGSAITFVSTVSYSTHTASLQ
jgi:uncharacterized protein YcbK (DUF882 family)